MRGTLRWIALALLAPATSGCMFVGVSTSLLTYHERRADEAVIYKTRAVELRVVRYRQSDMYSTLSYTYVVECGAKGKWMEVTGGHNSVAANAEVIAKELRPEFRTFGDDIVVWMWNGNPAIYAERCTSIRRWDPASIDASLLDPAPIWPKENEPAPLEAKPWFCARPGEDCRRWEFGGERRVRYENTTIAADGTIAFDAISRAFRSGRLHVESHDWGRTWRVGDGGAAPGGGRLQ